MLASLQSLDLEAFSSNGLLRTLLELPKTSPHPTYLRKGQAYDLRVDGAAEPVYVAPETLAWRAPRPRPRRERRRPPPARAEAPAAGAGDGGADDGAADDASDRSDRGSDPPSRRASRASNDNDDSSDVSDIEALGSFLEI